MANKAAIVLLTTVITILCVYELSFTFFASNYQKAATTYATSADGIIDNQKKQAYLDSIYNEEVLDLIAYQFTYQEVQEKALSLGLDLQGGMHVTLEVSPKEILKAMVSDPQDAAFNQALSKADEWQKESTAGYVDLFFEAYAEVSNDGSLADLFASVATQDKIQFTSTNAEVQEVVTEEVNQANARALQIIRSRIDKFGVSQANVQELGNGRIQVEMPGENNPKRVRKYLQAMAQLEFMDVVPAAEFFSYVSKINEYLLKKEKAEGGASTKAVDDLFGDGGKDDQAADAQADPEDLLAVEGDSSEATASAEEELFAEAPKGDSTATDSAANVAPQASEIFSLQAGNQQMIGTFDALFYRGLDTARINDILSDPNVQRLIPSNVSVHWGAKADPRFTTPIYTLHFLRRDRLGNAPLTGESVTKASWYNDPTGRGIAISMQMDVEGARIWQKMTKKAASLNPKGKVAIVLDDFVYSAPTVQGEIPGGQSSITGDFSIEEAQDLSNILKVGKLPAPTTIIEEAVVGPGLGRVAQTQGLTSIIVGLLFVIAFMFFYYAKGGMVANAALLINIFFIFGILSQFGATLSLPGLAGVVLTIGMSIDANVLIFERIREELRNGNNLMTAIEQGYDRAFWTIVDANLTTLLTGIFLLIFGAGPIQGFAVTLIIGILCSFFTAVFVSRVIVSWLTKRGNESKLSFSLPFTETLFTNLSFDFLAKRKIAYAFSGVIIAIGIALMATSGLNFGVDFQGGRSYIVAFDDVVEPTQLESGLKQEMDANFDVKTYDSNEKLLITTNLRIDEAGQEVDEQILSQVMGAITKVTGKTFTENQKEVQAGTFDLLKQTKVGETISDDIRWDAVQAVIASLIAIFLYIWVRFRKASFGIGAVVALFHDTLMVLSFFAIASALGLRFEIDQIFVAAMLTVVGYSINDTVVVFDRIREFLGLTTDKDVSKTINESISTTLSRTIITSFTTLLVVLILFLFGGEALRGFSFALLVGVFFGTYSSMFIATPVMFDVLPFFEKQVETKTEA